MLLVSAIQIQSSLTQLSLKSMSATHGQPCQPCFMADMVRIFGGGGKQKKMDNIHIKSVYTHSDTVHLWTYTML